MIAAVPQQSSAEGDTAVRTPSSRDDFLCGGQDQALDALRCERIYQRRAEQLAHRQPWRRNRAGGKSVLVVSAGSEKYGIELPLVKQIFRRLRYTPVPGVNPVIVGVANVSGVVCTVLDLAGLLGLPLREHNEHEKTVMVQFNDALIGLQVEEVCEVKQLSANSFDACREQTGATALKYVREVDRDGVAVLDPAALRTHDVFQKHQKHVSRTR